MQVMIATLAQAANVDKNENLNLLGAFSQIAAKEFPARHHSMTLVLRLHLEQEDSGPRRLGITLVDFDGREVFRARKDLVIPPIPAGAHQYLTEQLRFDGVTLKGSGQFSFLVSWDDRVEARVRLDVVRMPAGGT